MNGARTPRSAINSSTAAGDSKSLKSRGSAPERLSRGLRPQYWAANNPISVATQRLSIEKSRGSVGTAVIAFRVGAAVGRTLACVFARGISACGSVGSAVLAFGVGAAVGRTLSAAARRRHVVIVECHDDPFSFFPTAAEHRTVGVPRRLPRVCDHASRVFTREALAKPCCDAYLTW